MRLHVGTGHRCRDPGVSPPSGFGDAEQRTGGSGCDSLQLRVSRLFFRAGPDSEAFPAASEPGGIPNRPLPKASAGRKPTDLKSGTAHLSRTFASGYLLPGNRQQKRPLYRRPTYPASAFARTAERVSLAGGAAGATAVCGKAGTASLRGGRHELSERAGIQASVRNVQTGKRFSGLDQSEGLIHKNKQEECTMDRFATALVSKYTLKIPPEHDWFAPLVGDWDIRYIDSKDGMRREVKGEWLFRRVLNGTGIEDLLLCPSLNPECIMTIRMYHAEGKCYDATYTCEKAMCRLRFVKEGARLIGTNLDVPGEMQIFSDIRADYFKWNRVTVLEDRTQRVDCTIYASRKRE